MLSPRFPNPRTEESEPQVTGKELIEEVARCRAEGLDWIQFKVYGRMRGDTKRIAPGLYGRALGEQDTPNGTTFVVVDAKLDDVEKWIAKQTEKEAKAAIRTAKERDGK